MEPAVAWRSVLISVKSRDVTIYVNRTPEVLDKPIQVMEGKIIFFAISDREVKEVMKVLEDDYAYYDVPISVENFSYTPAERCLDFETSIDIDERLYRRLNKIDSGMTSILFSYIPTSWEFDHFDLNEKERKRMTSMMDKVEDIRNCVTEIARFSQRVRVDMPKLDKDEAMSVLTYMTERARITVDNIGTYMHNRHEIFAQMCMDAMNLPGGQTDISFKEFIEREFPDQRVNWSLMAKPDRTPDFLLYVAGKVILIEFTIPRGREDRAWERKMEKYQNTLEEMCQKLGVQSELVVITWNQEREITCTSDMDMFIPLNDSTFLEPLRLLNTAIRNIEGFDESRKLYDQIFDDNLVEDKKGYIEALLKMAQVMAEREFPERALSIEFSKTLAFMNQPNVAKMSASLAVDDENLSSIEAMNPDDQRMEVQDTLRYIIEKYDQDEFGFEASKILKQAYDRTEVLEKIRSEMKTQEEIGSRHGRKVPKFAKIPLIGSGTKGPACPMEELNRLEEYTMDGTLLFRNAGHTFDPPDPNRPGIGINKDSIDSLMTSLSELTRRRGGATQVESVIEFLEDTELMTILENMELLARECFLMSGRRFSTTNKPKFGAYKQFDNFSIMMAAGGKVMSDSQCVVKVLVEGKNVQRFNHLGRSFYETDEKDVYSTKWMTLQFADLEHFVTIKGRALVILSDMWERYRETEEDHSTILSTPTLTNLFMMPIWVMMEHKRNTSTNLQAARYVVHSGVGLASDQLKLVEEIFDIPIRTDLQGFAVMSMAKWFSHEVETRLSLTSYMKKMSDTSSVSDQLRVPSLFSNEEIDFQLTMSQIYFCNLINFSLGMKSHREKAILEKMMKVEKEYKRRVEEDRIRKPMEQAFMEKSEFCSYSPSFMGEAMRHYATKDGSKEIVLKAALHSMRFGVNKILKMTRTLKHIPFTLDGFVDTANPLKKCTVFEGLMEMVEELEMTDLLSMIEEDKAVFAVFSTFAKNQIGGAREILIQHIKTRIHTAMMNSFFEYLCNTHDKEMVTNEGEKRSRQSRTVLDFHEEASRINTSNQSTAIVVTINSDASKWAPSQVMETYMYFLSSVKEMIPKKLYNYFRTLFSAYSNKFLFAPDTFRDKFEGASLERMEEDEILALAKEFVDHEGCMMIHSGMGQGNFQHGSSWMHVLIDDYSDHLSKQVLRKFDVEMKEKTMISSDDSTKMLLLIMTPESGVATPEYMTKVATMMVDLYTGFRKCANIHINWKKTALQSIITEFNSVFTIMKKMYVASIKDCYNSVVVPDMTRPEDAVKEVISSCRRLLEGGCYLETIKVALEQNRNNLIKWFNLGPLMEELCLKLGVGPDDLPYTLGFVPTKMPLEVLVYGPELMIFSHESRILSDYYEKVYSVSELSVSSEESLDLDWTLMSSAKLEVSIRADKQLKALKSMYGRPREMVEDYLKLTDYSLSMMRYDYKRYLRDYISSVKRTYGFSSSYRMHSMVRAMQVCNSVRFGPSEKSMTLLESVDKVLSLVKYETYIDLMDNYRTICEEHKEIMAKMRFYRRKRMIRHPKSRTLTFYKRTLFDTETPESILNAIMSNNTDIKARHIFSIRRVLGMMGKTEGEFIKNPFSAILDSFSVNPVSNFKNFISVYCNTQRVSSMTVVSDFATKANRFQDMFSLYRHKTDPTCVFMEGTTDIESTSWRRTSNSITFESDELLWANYQTPDKLEFCHRMEKAVDMVLTGVDVKMRKNRIETKARNFEFLQEVFKTKRTYNRAKRKHILHYMSESCYATLEESGRYMFFEYHGSLDSNVAISVMRDVRVANKGIKFYQGRGRENLVEKEFHDLSMSLLSSVPAVKRMGTISTELVRGRTKWSVNLRYNNQTFNLWTSDYMVYNSEDSNISEMQRRIRSIPEMSLREVDQLLEDLGIEMNDFVLDKTESSKDPFAFSDNRNLIAAAWAAFTRPEPADDSITEVETVITKHTSQFNIITGEIMTAMLAEDKEKVTEVDENGVRLFDMIAANLSWVMDRELSFSVSSLFDNRDQYDAIASVIFNMLKRDITFEDKKMSDSLALMITAIKMKRTTYTMSISNSIGKIYRAAGKFEMENKYVFKRNRLKETQDMERYF